MKIALVMGGNRGLGKDVALTTARNGIGIILTNRSHKREVRALVGKIQAFGGKAATLRLDVVILDNLAATRVRQPRPPSVPEAPGCCSCRPT